MIGKVLLPWLLMPITATAAYTIFSTTSSSSLSSYGTRISSRFGNTSRPIAALLLLPRQTRAYCVSRKDTMALFGRKKGTLGRSVSAEDIVPMKKTKKESKEKTNKPKNDAVQISSSLSEWAKSLNANTEGVSAPSPSSSSPTIAASDTNVDTMLPSSFEPFPEDRKSLKRSSSSSGKNSRRERSNQRQASDEMKSLQIQKVLDDITTLIGSTNLPVEALVSKIKSLTQLPSTVTLKALLNQKAKDYSLAWVGSDEAICHIGTGLHKVPLARLQDIFLTLGRDGSGESKTIRLMEVIRILGPFPNVRNTLQGKITKIKTQENDDAQNNSAVLRKDIIQICYDSMFDGLGKQINAGTADNLRYVDLEVLFADERALVCVMPQSGDAKMMTREAEVFGERGENILLFLKEEDLDYKLEVLRAA